MTPEEFESIGNQACVSVAAGHACMWQGELLEPHLWEALRAELQRRYRRSTGETMAVLTIETPPPQSNVAVPDLRALAVEIVDGIRGYTFELSSHPAAHKDDYDFIEQKLRAALATTEGKDNA